MKRASPIQAPPGAAAIACTGCRKLKMRCIGSWDPPCERCSKAGKKCIVTLSNRGKQRSESSMTTRQHTALPSPTSSVNQVDKRTSNPCFQQSGAPRNGRREKSWYPASPSESTMGYSTDTQNPPPNYESPLDSAHLDQIPTPSLPSIYSVTPIATVEAITNHSKDPAQQRANSRPYTSGNDMTTISDLDGLDDIPEESIIQLIHLFRERIIYYVPVIDASDLENAVLVAKKEPPLALCASFVASRFVPGCGALHSRLAPLVSEFVSSISGPLASTEEEISTQLKALAILYAYGPAVDVYPSAQYTYPKSYISHWALKSTIETFAMRLSLHHSLEDIKQLLRTDVETIFQTRPFHKYVYWLWIFTMANHFSLVVRTPPTIREDHNIRSAITLLGGIPKPSRVARILAEVDLSMLWNQAGRRVPGLGEWWCAPPDDTDLAETISALEDVHAALDVWSQRWGVHGNTDCTYHGLDLANNGAVEFHYRITSFFIRTFATRCLHRQSLSVLGKETNPQSLTLQKSLQDSVVKSADAAKSLCHYFLDLGPMKTDRARYMADFGFAQISFCCLYIIHSFEAFGNSTLLIDHLNTAKQIAKLMIELAIGKNFYPRLCGESILERIHSSRSVRGLMEQHSRKSSPRNSTSPSERGSEGTHNNEETSDYIVVPVEWSTNSEAIVSGYGGSPIYTPDPQISPALQNDHQGRRFDVNTMFIYDPSWNFLASVIP